MHSLSFSSCQPLSIFQKNLQQSIRVITINSLLRLSENSIRSYLVFVASKEDTIPGIFI